MADSLRIAQPTALEIPVTVQGARTVEGTDKRELFVETTTTTIVLEKGAVLKLKAKVQPGQCLFLRNDQSGREILCRVLEARQAGRAGYTDLEFTAHDPDFWAVPAGQPAPAPQPAPPAPKPEAQKAPEAPGTTIPLPAMESIAPPPVGVLASPEKIELMAPADPIPETPQPLREADWDEAKDAELVAALSAMESSSKSQRQPAADEPPAETKKPRPAPASEIPQESLEPLLADPSEPIEIPASPAGIRGFRQFTAGKNPIALGIAAAVLFAAVLGVAWQAKSALSTHTNAAPKASLPPEKSALPVTAPSSPAPASPVAASANHVGAASGVAAMQGSSPSPASAIDITSNLASPSHSDIEQSIHRKPKANISETTPARIVAEPPPSIPPWAKQLDEEGGIVTLDALIDEKGNLVATKPLSGPRILQPAAERAVALWVFEPALANGKPVASHLVLTVQFQK